MANEKILNTRIKLKYDGYAHWDAVKNTFKPLPGEVCIVEVPTGNAAATTAPTVLFKVGAYKKDASGNNTTELHTFAELPWASALAADVYAWAKKATPDWTDFPALPIEVVDTETGKFVTDFEYSENKLTIHRSDVDWNDVKNAPDFALAADLGDVSKLNTTAKTAVGAINEHGAEIGDLASLNTTNKGNLVSAINEALQAVEVGGTGSVVTVTKQETPSEGSEATYVVKQGGNPVDVKIEIPKYDTSADYGILEVAGENAIKVETENQKATAKLVLDNTGNVAFSQSIAGLKAEVTHVAEAGKVDNALTVKLGGTDIVFDGSAAKTADVDSAIQGAKDYAKGLVEDIPAQTDYTVTCEDTEYEEAEGVPAFKRHTLKQNGNTVCTIDIPKELVVEAGSVKEVTEAGKPYDGAVVGDKYIELVIANQDTPIYVPAKDLVDIYTYAKDAKEVQVAISNTNEISATLVNGGITEDKLAEAVKTKLNKTWTEVKDFNDLSELVTGNNQTEGTVAYRIMVATESIMNEVNNLADNVYGDTSVAVEKAKADQNGNIIDQHYATAKSVKDLTDLIGSVDDGGILMELNNVENKLNLLGDDADSRDVNTRIADALADAKKDSADKAAVVLSEAQKYADGLASNYATAAQGQKADSALQEVVANDLADKPSGIKITEKNKIEVDDTIVWVFDCGDSTVE